MCVCVCVCVSELWVGRRDWHKGRKWAHVLVKPQLIDEPALSKCEPELVLKTAWRYWMPLPDTHTHSLSLMHTHTDTHKHSTAPSLPGTMGFVEAALPAPSSLSLGLIAGVTVPCRVII